ncbi:MAG: FtsQ-type POTRA domain-containing protein [Deltaproteobacteria bacterium]|nr:FtsQ-type POTRA domain-containing protein [Deltaproteobacteria bacterium]
MMKMISSFFKKRKSGSGYQAGEFPLRTVPGEYGSGQQRRKWSLSRIKYLFGSRKRVEPDGYSRQAPRSNRFYRRAILFLIVAATGWLIFSGGKGWVEKGLAKITFFQVNELVLSGCSSTNCTELREQSHIILHQTSLIGMKTMEIEKRLLQNPRVSSARVMRNWPAGVEIAIKEHVPVALLQSSTSHSGQLYYIDKKGEPYMPVAVGDNLDFPVVTGLAEVKDPNVKRRATEEVLIFLKKINKNNPHLPAQSVSEIHVNSAGELVVYLVEYPFPIFFGDGDTRKKYKKLVRVLQALYKKQRGEEIISRVEYIRMDYFNDKVLVAESESG